MTVLFIFLASLAALALGVLMIMAAGMADETGTNAPTTPFVIAGAGLIGTLVTVGIGIMHAVRWLTP